MDTSQPHAIIAAPRSSQCGPSRAALLQPPADRDFQTMERAFRAHGGLAGSEQVAAMLARRTDQPVSVLAHWIVEHDVLCIAWHGRLLLPLFQFDLHAMTARPIVRTVMHELMPVLGEWEAAVWFAQPNAWLADRAPVDALEPDPHAVYAAARLERHLSR
jgi:hypothetical protein